MGPPAASPCSDQFAVPAMPSICPAMPCNLAVHGVPSSSHLGRTSQPGHCSLGKPLSASPQGPTYPTCLGALANC